MTLSSTLIRTLLACLLAAGCLLGTAPAFAAQSEVQASVEKLSFDGLWDTRYGRVRLIQDGEQVIGSYSSVAGSTIRGEIEGERLNYRYSEGTRHGEGWFELAEDGKSWLIILEARWETGLQEAEYTFGEMLRSYFTMSPKVQIRERRFHDEADFRRFAGEVQYLAEPVVLLISTHGSPAGISVNGQTIGPEVIADCLQSASALSDFPYLTFLMMHGRSPAESVAQTHIAAPYTADKQVTGSRFRPLGLKLLSPSDLKLD